MKNHQSRDEHYDTAKSFLVIAMIVRHVFDNLYQPSYNPNYSIFVLIGFVFLAGVTVSAVNYQRIVHSRPETIRRLLKRSLKLLFIYGLCNLTILSVFKNRAEYVLNLNPWELMWAILPGTHKHVFGFDVLVPIAVTIGLSLVIMAYGRTVRFYAALAVLSLTTLFIFQSYRILDYYGIMLVLVGIFGCCTGSIAELFEENAFLKQRLSASRLLYGLVLGVMFYLLYLVSLSKSLPVRFYNHVIPTAVLLFAVYMLSYSLSLNKMTVFRVFNQTLARYMLFAYLFHIFVNTFFIRILGKQRLDVVNSMLMAMALLLITMAACKVVDLFTSKSIILKRTYSLVFK